VLHFYPIIDSEKNIRKRRIFSSIPLAKHFEMKDPKDGYMVF
jgi:hypothetical protein